MPEVSSTRLPVPHLFMVLSIGFFVLMMVTAFMPAGADDGGSTIVGPGVVAGEVSAPSIGCTGATDAWDPSCAGEW